MKRKILVLAMSVVGMLSLAGCNQQIIDTTYKFNRAIIYLPNGQVVEGKVDSWTDFENSDQIQVKVNGVTYLTHISNVVMIKE